MSESKSTDSPMQELFLRELATSFQATRDRINRRLEIARTNDDRQSIISEEIRGLYHGLLVTIDGGSVLADHGLISLIDEDGVPFKRWLHEIGFKYWPDKE